jgi:hypothetical protein
MPFTVFDIKGVPASRRERTEAAVVADGRHASGPMKRGSPRIRSTADFAQAHRDSSAPWCLLSTTIRQGSRNACANRLTSRDI